MIDGIETKFTDCDGLSVAYQVWGDGLKNIVLVPGMISHLEAALDESGYQKWMKALSSLGRVAVFDKRGNGMSDRIEGAPTIDERVLDIEAVMDAAGMETATLIGVSEGCCLACVYAAIMPARVESIILCGGYARGRLARGLVDEETLAQAVQEFRENWGKPGGMHPFSGFGPAADDLEGQKAFARMQRMSATPNTVAELFELAARIDVRALLPSVNKPTLVLHREEEVPNGSDAASDFVDMIPEVTYKPLPGHQHLPWDGEVDGYVAPIAEFITGAAYVPQNRSRVLATVLFTDLVESTAFQTRIGDDAWRELMNRHDRICSHLISGHNGRLIKFTGDGLLATFNSPTNALACSFALRNALEAIELTARFGLHSGEIEERSNDISGLGVVIAARIMALATEGQILSSELIRQLTMGAPFQFIDSGEYALKGVPETWRLYQVSQRNTGTQ